MKEQHSVKEVNGVGKVTITIISDIAKKALISLQTIYIGIRNTDKEAGHL